MPTERQQLEAVFIHARMFKGIEKNCKRKDLVKIGMNLRIPQTVANSLSVKILFCELYP